MQEVEDNPTQPMDLVALKGWREEETRNELLEALTSALASLPESQRKLLEATYFDRCDPAQLARRHERNLSTIRSRRYKAMQALRKLMGVQLDAAEPNGDQP
jgi:RNA polymerase sigma factor (sigma-70 family)